jgi:hypothetical protein
MEGDWVPAYIEVIISDLDSLLVVFLYIREK